MVFKLKEKEQEDFDFRQKEAKHFNDHIKLLKKEINSMLDELVVSVYSEIRLILEGPCTKFLNDYENGMVNDQISMKKAIHLLIENYPEEFFPEKKEMKVQSQSESIKKLKKTLDKSREEFAKIFNEVQMATNNAFQSIRGPEKSIFEFQIKKHLKNSLPTSAAQAGRGLVGFEEKGVYYMAFSDGTVQERSFENDDVIWSKKYELGEEASGHINCLALNKERKVLAVSGTTNKKIHFLDIDKKGEPLAGRPNIGLENFFNVWRIVWVDKDTLMVGTANGCLFSFSFQKHALKLVNDLNAGIESFETAEPTKGMNVLLWSGQSDGSLACFNENFQVIRHEKISDERFGCILYSKDLQVLFVGGESRELIAMDPITFRKKWVFSQSSVIFDLKLDISETFLLASFSDRIKDKGVFMINSKNGKLLAKLDTKGLFVPSLLRTNKPENEFIGSLNDENSLIRIEIKRNQNLILRNEKMG